jgi:pyruvate/2-oxoglutarate dehydrogenase complex dihydrolipoamide acyltransferase (E2) component
VDLTLPLLGEVMREGTLTAWLKDDGALVEEGEPVYQLQTDTLTHAVEAPARGVLRHIVPAGSTVVVGTLVAHLAEDPAAGDTGEGDAGLGLTPAARRRLIAQRLVTSLRDTAQLTIALELDLTEAEGLRQQLKQLWPADAQPTITDLVLRATVLALHLHPDLNATLADDRLTHHEQIDLAVAVDHDDGLLVPVLKDVGHVSLKELSHRAKELAGKARLNKLTLDDRQGGTFTVTSLGQFGIDFFTPIVIPPQVAILGIGRAFEKLVLAQGRVEQRTALYLNLSFDQRAIDGAPAARFLNSVQRFLELPAALVAL